MDHITKINQFVDQIISLAWLKCLMTEGVEFVNKDTGRPEKNEMILFHHFEQQTGVFDLPAAEASPKGLEASIYEVFGRFWVNNRDPDTRMLMSSSDFLSAMKMKIDKIIEKSKKPLRGSEIEDYATEAPAPPAFKD